MELHPSFLDIIAASATFSAGITISFEKSGVLNIILFPIVVFYLQLASPNKDILLYDHNIFIFQSKILIH